MRHVHKLHKGAQKKPKQKIASAGECSRNDSTRTVETGMSSDIGHSRFCGDLAYEQEGAFGGCPVDSGVLGLSQAIRAAKELHRGPQSLISSF